MIRRMILIITVLSLFKVAYGQAETQLISKINKLVIEINDNKSNYRIIPAGIISNIIDTAYKSDNNLVLYRVNQTLKEIVSDYYFDNNNLIYLEVKNKNGNIEKTYYSEGRIIVRYNKGEIVDISEDSLTMRQKAMLQAIEKLIIRYENL